ncbi:hypothetical protein ACOME3_001209 [Neoechinorhynchus agilis]
MHSLALCIDGTIWSWGCNDDGALGRETDETEYIPGPVDYLPPIVDIMAGDGHSVALDESGRAYVSGVFRDDNEKIGLLDRLDSKEGSNRFVDIDLNGEKRFAFSYVASGNNHILLLTENGEVKGLGSSVQSQLGSQHSRSDWLTPRQITSAKCDKVWCGHFSSFMRPSGANDCLVLGLNNASQLGFSMPFSNDKMIVSSPLSIGSKWFGSDADNGSDVEISGADHHTLSVSSQGFVYASGSTEYGRLGLNNFIGGDLAFPRVVPALVGYKIKHVSSGIATSYAVTQCGRLFTWGMGDTFSTGHGEDVYKPKKLLFGKYRKLRFVKKPFCLDVKAGGQHALILAR